jgi:hypothetical protein
VLPRKRAKFLHLPVTPTEWLRMAEKSIHRLLLNSPTYPLGLELVLHSAIVTDFAMERLSDSHFSCPESRICFKVETVTRTERASQEKNRNSHLPVTPTEWLLHRREEHSPAVVEVIYMELSACLRVGSSLRNCDRLCHGKTYLDCL